VSPSKLLRAAENAFLFLSSFQKFISFHSLPSAGLAVAKMNSAGKKHVRIVEDAKFLWEKREMKTVIFRTLFGTLHEHVVKNWV